MYEQRLHLGSKEIGIYTAYFYWRENAPTQPAELEYFHRYPLWIANYGTSQPMVPKPWVADEWLFWQYTASGDGLYFGVESLEIDLNYFNGDAQEFARRFNVPVPEDPLPPTDPVGNRYRVTAASLYVREGPGTTYPPVGSLAAERYRRGARHQSRWELVPHPPPVRWPDGLVRLRRPGEDQHASPAASPHR